MAFRPYVVEYRNPRHADVISSGLVGNDAFIEYESLDGFIGGFEDTGIQSVGVPGQTVDFRDRVIPPMEGGFMLVVKSPDAYVKVRRLFSTTDLGYLTITGERRVEIPVRLAESLPSPSSVPVVGSRIPVRLVNDQGVGFISMAQKGPKVTVTNYGDVPIPLEIEWEGTSGDVILQSGARFSLPSVNGRHTLKLDRRHNGEVYDSAGVYQHALTKRIGAVGELVPVDKEHTITLPSAAVLKWNVGVLDPWI